MKHSITCIILLLLAYSGHAQDLASATDTVVTENIRFAPEKETQDVFNEKVYKLNLPVDIPVTAACAGWTLYMLSQVYSKDTIPVSTVAALNKDDLNGLDRWAAGKYSPAMDDASNYLFYGSLPLPALLFIDKKIRKDAAKIALMYVEAYSITGTMYTSATYFVDRYRPETYTTELTPEEKTNGNFKNSFFAGHVAVVSTATFFMAKVYSDYHPESKWKWAFWTGAGLATGAMIYMRHEAGKHFPTDLALGTAVGVLSGVLVPHFHKVKDPSKHAWHLGPSVNPNGDGVGLSFNYRFK